MIMKHETQNENECETKEKQHRIAIANGKRLMNELATKID